MTYAASARAIIVLTTLGESADAAAFARTLVEERLAACVNVFPLMTSTYRWQGAVETAREHQLIVKTTVGRLPALEDRLKTLHPYDVPELLVVDVSGGAEAYLAWLHASVESQGS